MAEGRNLVSIKRNRYIFLTLLGLGILATFFSFIFTASEKAERQLSSSATSETELISGQTVVQRFTCPVDNLTELSFEVNVKGNPEGGVILTELYDVEQKEVVQSQETALAQAEAAKKVFLGLEDFQNTKGKPYELRITFQAQGTTGKFYINTADPSTDLKELTDATGKLAGSAVLSCGYISYSRPLLTESFLFTLVALALLIVNENHIKKEKVVIKKDRNWKKIIGKGSLYLALILLVSLLVELFVFNFRQIFMTPSEQRNIEVTSDMLSFSGFDREENGWRATEENAQITVKFPAQYVKKFSFSYENLPDQSFGLTFLLDGEPVKEIAVEARPRLDTAYEIVEAVADTAVLSFPKEGVLVQSITIKNDIQFNIWRFLLIGISAGIALLVIKLPADLRRRPQVFFVIAATLFGLFIITAGPSNSATSWDDHIHFERAYSLSFLRTEVWTESAQDFVSNVMRPADNLELKNEATEYVNSHNNIVDTETHSWWEIFKKPGYWPSSAMLALGRTLGLPFETVFQFGKLGNLIFYIAGIYLSIKMLPRGKYLLTVVALMPSPLFLACSYSVDPVVITGIVLMFSAIYYEFYHYREPLNLRNTILLFIGAILGSYAKALYIPLILLALFYPKEKFYSKRAQLLFKIVVILVFIIILGMAILPTAVNPAQTGDTRMDGSSNAGQLAFIFSDPFRYTGILLSSIWNNLGSFFVGEAFSLMGYIGTVPPTVQYIALAVLFFSLYAESKEATDGFTLKRYQKLSLAVLLFGIICLVWTSLYVDFSPVGYGVIIGVQARYFLPILFPLLALFMTKNMRSDIRLVNYSKIVYGGSSFVLAASCCSVVLPWCL